MKLSFIYPSFTAVENQPNIKAIADNYGVFPPLSLAYVAGIADAIGTHEIQFIDGNALKLSPQEIIERLDSFSADIVFMTITTYMFHENLSWIRHIKKNTKAKVIVGGQHLSMYPHESLAHEEIDIALIGEAEDTLPELLAALENHTDLHAISGIGFRDKEKIVLTAPRIPRKELNGLPYPARKYLPNSLYTSFISQKKNFSGIMTSRGCPYQCGFCEQKSGNFRGRNAQDVMKELTECYHLYDIREFEVFDPLFTTNKQRVIEICKEIIDSGLKFDWSIRSRVDRIDEELCQWLSKANCKRIYFGIESGNEQILKNLNKNTTLVQIRNAVHLTKKYNIDRFGYFMIGSPGETQETIKDTIKLATSLPLTYAQFSRFSILPGTDIYESWKKEFGYDYWREFVKDESKRKVMPLYNCTLSEEEIEKWIKKAYYQFYFRPQFMARYVARMKSFDEFKRTVKAAVDMIIS